MEIKEIWKENKFRIIIGVILTLLPMIFGIYWWEKLPREMATHFGIDGQPNGWSPKEVTVFVIPILLCVFYLFGLFFMNQDPKLNNINKKIKSILCWIFPVCSWIVAIGTYSYELDYAISFMDYVPIVFGFVIIIIGNYMPKCGQNFSVGFRTKWTLSNENVWYKTHRLAGILWVIGGTVILFASLIKNQVFVLAILVGVIVLPMIYSYIIYQKETKKEKNS